MIDPNNNLGFYTKLREYKENILLFPTVDIYNVIYRCELLFRKHARQIFSNTLTISKFIEMFLKTHPVEFIPSCTTCTYKKVRHCQDTFCSKERKL